MGAVAAAVGSPLGVHILKANGNYIFPANALTKVQIVAGSGTLLAITAIAVAALGTIVRTSAAAEPRSLLPVTSNPAVEG